MYCFGSGFVGACASAIHYWKNGKLSNRMWYINRGQITATEKKAGFPIACPNCQSRNKIPGIAMQAQATKGQIEQLQMALNRHRQSIWALFIFIIIGIGITLFGVGNSSTQSPIVGLSAGLLIGLILVVLVPVLKSCEYLGVNKVINMVLFFFLSGIWIIVSIILYVELKKRIDILKMAGIRGEKDLSGRFADLI